jgi:hypothetical protein
MSNPAVELERGRTVDKTRALTVAAWSFAVWVAVFLVFAGIRNANETQKELRLIPWLPYDERVDFAYFYAAATMVRNGDAGELYPPKHEYIFYPGDPAFDASSDQDIKARLLTRGNYYNPPVLAVLEAPLTSLGFKTAYWLYSALSIAAFVVFLGIAWTSGRQVPEMPLVILGLAAFRPVHEAVIMGHQSLFFVLALGAGFLALRAKQPLLAGLMLSLLAVKPQWAVAPALFLLFRREWRALAAMGIASSAIFFLPFLAIGHHTLAAYVNFLRDQSGADLVSAPHMFSWNGFLSKLEPNDPFVLPVADIDKTVLYVLEAATALVVLFIWLGRDFYFGVAATIVGMLLISTHSVWYDWAFLAVAALFLVLRPGTVLVRGQVWMLLIALFVSAGQSVATVFAPDGRHGFLHWSEAGFFSVTLVAAGTLLWIAGRVILEGQVRFPDLRRRPASLAA